MRLSTGLALAVLIALGSSGRIFAQEAMRQPDYVRPEGNEVARSQYRGDVYLLRGFGDVFSRGLDELGRKLNERGIKARVISHFEWSSAADDIVAEQKKYGRRPVILIGHSLGANAAILMAKRLRRENIPVQYLATLAATAPDPVPDNVGTVDNYYFATNGWGEKIVGGSGFHGRMENRDYSDDRAVGHFNIEKQAEIQEQIIRNVMRYMKPSQRRAAS